VKGPEAKSKHSRVPVNMSKAGRWENCTLEEIKAELKKRNAKVSGRKADLIAR